MVPVQILCEQCKTAYVLDDKLIPPSGAPVQCTRCGFVFTAKPKTSAHSVPPPPSALHRPKSTPPSSSATMMFGAPPDTNVAAVSPNQTMMFGKAVPQPPTSKPQYRTKVFGNPPPASEPSIGNEATAIRPSPNLASPIPSSPSSPGSEEKLTEEPLKTEPPFSAAVLAKEKHVGYSPFLAAPAKDCENALEQALESSLQSAGTQTNHLDPERAEPNIASSNSPRAAQSPSIAPRFSRGSSPLPMPERVGAQTMQLQVALRRRQRRGPIIAAVIGGIVLVTAAIGIFLSLRTPSADSRYVQADLKALELLKLDDSASLTQAIDYWKKLEPRDPEYVPFQTNQAMAHALLAYDIRNEIDRINEHRLITLQEKKLLEEKKEPNDWRARANTLGAQYVADINRVNALSKEAEIHDEQISKILQKTKQLVQNLGVAGDTGTWYRAAAIYYTSRGSAEQYKNFVEPYKKFADRRETLNDPSRAFADLAMALYYSGSRSEPDWQKKGIAAALDALRKDPKLLRAQFVLAKIYFSNKEYAQAKETIKQLLERNPKHSAAKKLMEEVENAANKP